MSELSDLQISDSNNTATYPIGTMTVQQLDDAGRVVCGMLARWYKDNDGSNTTAGTGAAYTLTLNRSGATTHAAVGQVTVRANVANTGAATINPNSIGAKAITKRGGAALVVGDILQNDIITLVYNPARDNYQLMGI